MVLFSRGKNELSFTFAYIRCFDSEKKLKSHVYPNFSLQSL